MWYVKLIKDLILPGHPDIEKVKNVPSTSRFSIIDRLIGASLSPYYRLADITRALNSTQGCKN